MVTCVPGQSDLHRFGEHVRGVVADELQRARIVAGEELDLGVVLDRIGEVGELAVERHGDRALGERRRNALGDVEAGGVWRIVPTRAVGKGHGDHVLAPFAHSCERAQVSVTVRYVTYAAAKASHAAVQHDLCVAFRCRAAHSGPMCGSRDTGQHSSASALSPCAAAIARRDSKRFGVAPMTDKPRSHEPRMETFGIPGTNLVTSRIGLGTWAIGGWMWGGTDEAESIRTIHAALDRGITLIDTAPVYGFGRSEEIVGKALAEGGRRAGVVLATKVALDWKNEQPFRDGSRARIMKEIDDSLRRLRTDIIDLYQIHWPDPKTPNRGNRGRDGGPAQGRQDPRHRREQFFTGANGRLRRCGAAARRAAALQSVRTRHRGGCSSLRP